jgi:glycerol-3-phosphate dehydrogenase (NAD+)
VKLPANIVATPNLREAVKDAHVLVFVMPHQFIKSLCHEIQGHVLPGAKAISLVKGFDCEGNQINLMSEYIRKTLGIECSSLSGANVAEGVANEQFSETTVGYNADDFESAQLFQSLFDTPFFRVNAVADVAGVEICGALKNVIALAAGFCDGLGYGSNTKAAILRIGMYEMRKFAAMFYSDTIDEVFWDSAGIADLLTTCYGGRNRRCAEEFVRTGKSWKEIENTLLKGQKLQGTSTTRDVYAFLTGQGKRDEFPLMCAVYEIADTGKPADTIVKIFMSSVPRQINKDRTPISKL